MVDVLRVVRCYKRHLIVACITLFALPLVFKGGQEEKCAYVMLVMGSCWVTEVVPISITALLPVFFLPVLGLVPTKVVASKYMKDSVIMFSGGLIMAIGVEQVDLHRHLALNFLLFIGTQPHRLIIGFSLIGWFLSMWISNTATIAMLLPCIEAVLNTLHKTTEQEQDGGGDIKRNVKYAKDSLGEDTGNNHTELSGVVLESDQQEQLIQGPRDISQDVDNGMQTATDITNLNIRVQAPIRHSTLENNDSIEQIDTKDDSEGEYIVVGRKEEQGDIDVELVYDFRPVDDARESNFRNLAKALTLSTVYCGKAGGMATLTGTPPTVIMKGIIDEWWEMKGLGEGPITFPSWMVVGFPISILITAATIVWLQIVFLGFRATFRPSNVYNAKVRQTIIRERQQLGKLKFKQWAVLLLFVVLVFLWFFRQPGFMPGWASNLKPGYISDAVPAIIIPFFLFIIPNELTYNAPPILDWKAVHEKFPWLVIWMVGGGFALADAAMKSGLSAWFGTKLMTLSGLPHWFMLGVICLVVSFLTEVTSNSATVTLLLPIVASFAESLRLNPLYLMWPVTLAAEFAFMLPTSSASAALGLTTGRVNIADMIKAGFLLNIIGVLFLVIAAHSWGWLYFDHGTVPYELPQLNATTISLAGNGTI